MMADRPDGDVTEAMMSLRMASRYRYMRRQEIMQEFVSMQQAGVILFGGLTFLTRRRLSLEGLTPDWAIGVMTGRAELPDHARDGAERRDDNGPAA
jgi:hypothetical protein